MTDQMLAHAALPASEIELPPLDAFPWLVRSDEAPSIAHNDNRKTSPGRSRLLPHVGIAMAIVALCSGVSYLAGGSAGEPAPVMQTKDLGQNIKPAASPAAQGALGGDPAADSAARLAAPETPAAAPERDTRAAAATRLRPATGIAAPAPAPHITPALGEAQATAADAASLSVAPAPPAAESPASAATLREFRLAMEQSRDAVRQVIRLGNRQKPPRDASPEELAAYRLRQQNAEAARGYRDYLDTLARSMRGTQSESAAQQSLEKARQTLGYLATMLADSQASLR